MSTASESMRVAAIEAAARKKVIKSLVNSGLRTILASCRKTRAEATEKINQLAIFHANTTTYEQEAMKELIEKISKIEGYIGNQLVE